MNLSGRERKLLIALGVVVVLLAVWFLFLRPSSEPIVIEEILPSVTPSAVVTPDAPGTPGAIGSPTFVVPAGARDPFKA
ncbi:MAG: hypothetical protein ACKOKE_03060 [Actinomycetota bacterium]